MKPLLLRIAAALMLFALLSTIASVPATGAYTGDEIAIGATDGPVATAVNEAERNREVEEAEETAEETIGIL